MPRLSKIFPKSRRYCQSGGFTLVELTIVTLIAIVLSGVFLANIRQGESGRSLRITTDSLLSAYRLAQNNTLSGLPAISGLTALDWGVVINPSPYRYNIFVEENDGSGNPTDYQSVEQWDFPNRVSYSNLRINGQAVPSAQVRFFRPYGEIKITGGSFNNEKNAVLTFQVNYQGATQSYTVTVDGVSGRIVVQ